MKGKEEERSRQKSSQVRISYLKKEKVSSRNKVCILNWIEWGLAARTKTGTPEDFRFYSEFAKPHKIRPAS